MQSTHHLVSRRRFLVTSALGFGGSLLALSSVGSAAAAAPAFGISSAAKLGCAAQSHPDHGRVWVASTSAATRTSAISTRSSRASRAVGGRRPATEGLFYYNMLDDQFIPWLAEGYAYNPDYTQLTVNLRNGVEWSDGQPFTARDVVFTLGLLQEQSGSERGGVRYPAPGRQRDGAGRSDGGDQSDRADAALPLGLSDLPRGHRHSDRAAAHLGWPGPEQLQQLRSVQGLAGRHGSVQAGVRGRAAEDLGRRDQTGGAPRRASARCRKYRG